MTVCNLKWQIMWLYFSGRRLQDSLDVLFFFHSSQVAILPIDKMASHIGFCEFDILAQIPYNMTRTINEERWNFLWCLCWKFRILLYCQGDDLSIVFLFVQASNSKKACVNGSVFVRHPLEANFAGVFKHPHTEVRGTTMDSKWAV